MTQLRQTLQRYFTQKEVKITEPPKLRESARELNKLIDEISQELDQEDLVQDLTLHQLQQKTALLHRAQRELRGMNKIRRGST